MEMGWGEVAVTNKGFTLLEVLFALAIFTVCSLSIAGMLIIGKKAASNGINSFIAVQASKGQMEILRSSGIQNSATDTCSTLSLSSILCVWSVKKDVPDPGLSTLEVTASWKEGDNNKQLVLKTLRFNRNE
ncbi:MAG: prepilin-type N-terminal cleavage/methylation domain-containing protein [Nitrospira sp.]|nr:prepilin-type N-terminal cleavage/methylation domain-containing protein [Nitrospira sp.]